jgi:excisionase family DNA binding protein
MTAQLNTTSDAIAGPDRTRGELLDVKSLATKLDCSTRHIYRLADAGRMPRPLKLGALVRWRAGDIHEWLDAGCPSVRTAKGGAR